MSSLSFISRSCLAAVTGAALLASLFPAGALAAEPLARLEAAAFSDGSGRARLALAAPRPVPTAASKRPLIAQTIAAADVDGDGAPDVVAALSDGRAGLISVSPGDGRTGFRTARSFDLPAPVDLLATGDFDADGHIDLAAAARDARALFLVRGDGRGGFATPTEIALPGRVTALAAGEIGRRDGATDLAVAIADGAGDAALVFPKAGAEPRRVDLPARATSLAIADVDADGMRDLVAAGTDLVVAFGGSGEVATTRLTNPALSAIEGQFADAGQVSLVLDGGDIVTVPVIPTKRRTELSTRPLASIPGATVVVAANIATGEGDEIVALGTGADKLRVLAREDGETVELAAPVGAPVAAVAARLNGDALDDLLVLDPDGSVRVIASAKTATFVVTTTNDSGDGSLRQAIDDANTSPGPDEIVFNIPGKGVHTITPLSALPSITDAVTIDGYTQPGSRQNSLALGTDAVLNVEIAGDGLVANGLTITASSVLVRGLVVNGFEEGVGDVEITGVGILVLGTPETIDDVVEGCYLGTDPTGTVEKGNDDAGIGLIGVSRATVGGVGPAARNLVSSTAFGIAAADGVNDSVVAGNYVGTDASGENTLGRILDGISFDEASHGNTIGGAGAGNVVAGCSQGIVAKAPGTSFNLIANNLIGTNAAGTAAIGDSNTGVFVSDGASNNTIAENVVASQVDGITILGDETTGCIVRGNAVGTDRTGTLDFGNGNFGMLVTASQTQIDENTIAFNGGAGIDVPEGTGNSIAGNSIFSNGGIGIDLANDGPTANDPDDADDGANRLQNFPVITSAVVSGGTVTVSGTLQSTPSSQFAIRVYAADASGQGKTSLNGVTTLSDENGLLVFTARTEGLVPGSVTAVTATATSDETDDTSEFAPAVAAEVVELGGQVLGTVFVDADADGRRDEGEIGRAGVTVFADLDGDGKLVDGEPSATTEADGSYDLAITADVEVAVRLILADGVEQTTPDPDAVKVQGGAVVSGVDFGVADQARFACLVDDRTGDTFSIGVLHGDPEFGKWTYRIAATGRTITGKATSMVFVQPKTLKALEFDGVGILMNVNVSIDTATGKAKVVDVAGGVKLLTVIDKVEGGGC